MEKNKRFRLVRFAFETRDGGILYRYMITEDKIPMLEVNQWLMAKAMRKASTSKEYGKKLVVFLNYLSDNDADYSVATNEHVKRFIRLLLFGDMEDLKLLYYETNRVYQTAAYYLTVITEFYKWLDDNYGSNMEFRRKSNHYHARKSFLYGQIYNYYYQYILDAALPRQKPRREYIKWYTKEQIDLMCCHFTTLRDEAVFRLTLEGFRIDEVLSMKLSDYDSVKQLIQPTRSKGRSEVYTGNQNHLRVVALPELLCILLNCYISTERSDAENGYGIPSEYLFLNLQKDNMQGKPMTYHNYYAILKRCAKRAGFEPEMIRSHSGRSTKVMEFLEHQAKHPEDEIEDSTIMQCFGWRSADSISSYRDYNNQVIAYETMKKLHKKERKPDDTDA